VEARLCLQGDIGSPLFLEGWFRQVLLA
jgi:hypothetical protein